MEKIKALEARMLCPHCDPNQFNFNTTDELQDALPAAANQNQINDLNLELDFKQLGYNLFAVIPTNGANKQEIVLQLLQKKISELPIPPDLCYVHNFIQPRKPKILTLPAGLGKKLSQDMKRLISELQTEIPAILSSDEYRARLLKIDRVYQTKFSKKFAVLQRKAEKENFAVIKNSAGFSITPINEQGYTLTIEEFEKLPKKVKQCKEKIMKELRQKLAKFIEKTNEWQRLRQQKISKLQKDFITLVVQVLILQLKHIYKKFPTINKYLTAVQKDIMTNEQIFHNLEEQGQSFIENPAFTRYRVNVMVDHSETTTAPIIYENNPHFANLLGSIDHTSESGDSALHANLIRPGALHRANGGYLVIDVLKVLSYTHAWEGLKRALRVRKIHIDSIGELLGRVHAKKLNLEPEPIPMNVKVILLGDPFIYYLLSELDPDFKNLFKINLHSQHYPNKIENIQLYPKLIGTLSNKEHCRPLDKQAVARVIDYCARLAHDSRKLSTHLRSLVDLLCEADYWAGKELRSAINEQDIQQAIHHQIYRGIQARKRLYEEIKNETSFITTEGHIIGQINELAVIQLGDFVFSFPSRICTTINKNQTGKLQIQFRTQSGRTIHSKANNILANYLNNQYLKEQPLSLTAQLIFEQSYRPKENDLASIAELCVLLSALAQMPIRQDLAVVGSIDQYGQIHTFDDINEKIEGFFDICKNRGLTGKQGVLIPAINVEHLMLSEEVVQAAQNKKFHIYPIENVDQAISMLIGMAAGKKTTKGCFPKNSFHAKVMSALHLAPITTNTPQQVRQNVIRIDSTRNMAS